MTKARTKVFRDNEGNRFIFQSMIIIEGDEEARTNYDVTSSARVYAMMLNVKVEDGWFEFDPDNFPYVETDATHRNFEHGGSTVLMFDGPLFEKIKREIYDI